jgi:hypothetical protein
MNISRRRFLRVGSMIGVSAAVIPGTLASIALGQKSQDDKFELGTGIGFPIPRAALADPLANITRAQWQQNMGSNFSFSQRSTKLVDMTLWAVNDENPSFVPSGNSASTRECFSLVFTGPPSPNLGQGTFAIAHPRLGKFNLFIVPGIHSGYYRHYEALINRVYP